MLIVPLTVSLQLAASGAPLPPGHWIPVPAMDHPYEAVATFETSGDAGAWSLQDGAVGKSCTGSSSQDESNDNPETTRTPA